MQQSKDLLQEQKEDCLNCLILPAVLIKVDKYIPR